MFVYLIFNEATGEHKIGKSKHPEKRVAELQTGSPGKLTLLSKFKSVRPFELETYVQAFFRDDHVGGEWFYIGIICEERFQDRCKHFEAYIALRYNNDDISDW